MDGILLGAETLRGKYAVQTVQTILAICHQAEKAFDHNYHFEHLMQASALHLLVLQSAEALVRSAAVLAAVKVPLLKSVGSPLPSNQRPGAVDAAGMIT